MKNLFKLLFSFVFIFGFITLINPLESQAQTTSNVNTEKFKNSNGGAQQLRRDGDDAYYTSLMIRYGVFNDDNVYSWHNGGYGHPIENLMYHYEKHKNDPGINSKNMSQYMRQAKAFKQNLKGAKKVKVSGRTPDVYKYMKSGKYIMIHKPTGLIVSFGSRDH